MLVASLRTAFDIVFAPARAYAAIACMRSWIVPYVIIVLLDALAAVIPEPAYAHVIAAEAQRTHAVVDTSPSGIIGFVFVQTVITQALWWPVAAILFTIMTPRPENGETERPLPALFSSLFTLCVYSAIPLALGNVIQALVIRAHDPLSLHSSADLASAVPLTMASLLPHALPNERIFLGSVDIFTLWSLILTALGVTVITKIRSIATLIAVFAMELAELALFALQPQQ